MARTLETTPLDALHRRLGARMAEFAGYDLPVNFPPGVLKEHLHCRAAASLFDVSHMGQIVLAGENADAMCLALERLVPADILGLPSGRQRYTQFTDANGGILDDLMVARLDDRLLLVVNAANKTADLDHLRMSLPASVSATPLAHALIALQGPKAVDVLSELAPPVEQLRFLDVAEVALDGVDCIVARSGYTGEDGFEISVPVEHVERLAERLLAPPIVEPAGLGARDSLRLEAGLCLHGADISLSTNPIEAGLAWSIPKVRRLGGAREAGFPGAARIFEELATSVSQRRVGLRPKGRAPVRAGTPLYSSASSTDLAGAVTSGGFGPSVGAPIAMGYLEIDFATPGTVVHAELRGRRDPVEVVPLPFIEPGYKR